MLEFGFWTKVNKYIAHVLCTNLIFQKRCTHVNMCIKIYGKDKVSIYTLLMRMDVNIYIQNVQYILQLVCLCRVFVILYKSNHFRVVYTYLLFFPVHITTRTYLKHDPLFHCTPTDWRIITLHIYNQTWEREYELLLQGTAKILVYLGLICLTTLNFVQVIIKFKLKQCDKPRMRNVFFFF